jgi:hypothetical protein
VKEKNMSELREPKPRKPMNKTFGLITIILLIVISLFLLSSRTDSAAALVELIQAEKLDFLPIVLKAAHQVPTATVTPIPTSTPGATQTPFPNDEYALLGWNDLGMHCYNRDFQDLAVLPPFNNLWVQVVKRGDPPQIVTLNIKVEYSFPANTYSVGKSNFWQYDLPLFGVDLPANVELKERSCGEMDLSGIASSPGIPDEFETHILSAEPYQLAQIIVKDLADTVLASNYIVSPVSTEMHCDSCHFDGGVEGIATGRVETNILTFHDLEHVDQYPAGHQGALMNRRPILCAECHSSNALGAPGVAGLPSLSNAMHNKHTEIVPDSLQGCYNCHPGPKTQCLRDIMSQKGMTCIHCHGGMSQVKENPNPWLNEPRCDACHTDPKYAQNQPLYRHSTGHGGIYCEACHDSTHAIAPSTQPRDAIKFINLQGTRVPG